MNMGTELVTRTVDMIAAGETHPVEQNVDESTLKPAPKIFKEDCRIDWQWEGQRIVNFVRGLSPYPAAWGAMHKAGEEKELTVKIFEAHFEQKQHGQPCGTIESDGRTFIRVACKDGWVTLNELQLAGKKRLSVHDLLLGFRDVLQYEFA